MVTRATKSCDACGRKVAEKKLIFFHTVEGYVTVTVDEPSDFFSDAHTVRDKEHFCRRCWFGIVAEARKAVK